MQRVGATFETGREVPFAMRFMQLPSHGDLPHAQNVTMTTVYTTNSGPTNAPDDGAVDNRDD